MKMHEKIKILKHILYILQYFLPFQAQIPSFDPHLTLSPNNKCKTIAN